MKKLRTSVINWKSDIAQRARPDELVAIDPTLHLFMCSNISIPVMDVFTGIQAAHSCIKINENGKPKIKT